MKSHVQYGKSFTRQLKQDAKRYALEYNEGFHDVFDASILYALHLHPRLKFGRKRLQYVYEAVHDAYRELRETYCAENDELYELILYKLRDELDIDLNKWEKGDFS